MDDQISRNTLLRYVADWQYSEAIVGNEAVYDTIEKFYHMVEEMPSAQPESCEYYALCRHGRDENKLRERLGFCEYCNEDSDGYVKPQVQPESRREWYMKGYRDAQAVSCTDLCVDCPLFDHEKHECPRFNRVIPRAIEEVKPRWIPVTPDSPPLYMPVLTWDGGTRHVEQRIPYIRDEYGEKIISDWWIDGDEKWDEWAEYQPNLRDGCAIKWLPLPEPYEEGQDEVN